MGSWSSMSVHGWKIYIYLHGISGCESQFKSKLTFLHCFSAMVLVVSSRADLMAFSTRGENIKISQVEYIWECPQYYIYIISTHFCRQFFLDRPQKSSWHKHTGFVDSWNSQFELHMETGLDVQGFKVVLRTRLHHKHCFQNITSDKKSKFYTCFQMSFFHRRVHFPCYKGLQSARQSLKRILKNTTCLRESTKKHKTRRNKACPSWWGSGSQKRK